MNCKICHLNPCVCAVRVAAMLKDQPVVMDKAFIDRVLPTIPTEILIHEVMKRLGKDLPNASSTARARTITFKAGDEIPVFPLAVYPFPIDVARHWLLANKKIEFEFNDLKSACSGQKVLYGSFNTSRVIQRLRGTGEVTVHSVGGPYVTTKDLHFDVSEENLRRSNES